MSCWTTARTGCSTRPSQERATALIEVGKIINHRFDDLVAEANPIHTARTQRFDNLGH